MKRTLITLSLWVTLSPTWAQLPTNLSDLDKWINELPKKEVSIDSIHKAIDSLRRTDLELFKKYVDYTLEMSQDLEYATGQTRSYNLLGVYYVNLDLYEKAMENYLKAISLCDSLGNEKGAATISANVGIIYDQIGQADKAKEYFTKSYKYFKSVDHARYMNILELNLGAAYFNLENYDSALHYFQTIIPYRDSVGNTHGLGVAYSNIGETYAYLEDYPESIKNYEKSLEYLQEDHDMLTDVYVGLGRSLIKNKQHKKGMEYLNSGLELAIENKYKRFEEAVYKYKKEYYVEVDDYKKAFLFQTKEHEIEKELRGEEVQGKIELINLKYEDEKKAKQLAILEKQRAQDELYLLYTAGGGGFLLVTALLLIITLRLKVKNEKLKAQELKIKLEHKTRELTSYALNFVQKNALMQDLTTKIDDLKTKSDTQGIKDLNQMNKIINSSFRIDQDWENFKVMFEEVHSGFIMRLKDQYPELGNAELKLCALLRLNMNLKEASSVLGISPDSVKTARYRLRKKLELNTDDNLVDFLIQFDNQAVLQSA